MVFSLFKKNKTTNEVTSEVEVDVAVNPDIDVNVAPVIQNQINTDGLAQGLILNSYQQTQAEAVTDDIRASKFASAAAEFGKSAIVIIGAGVAAWTIIRRRN